MGACQARPCSAPSPDRRRPASRISEASMAATQKTQGTGNPFSPSSADLTDLTIAVNRIAANQRQANAYEIRNTILVDEEKERVRYKNGVTELPCSVQRLFADAQRRNANHRRTLARNIVRASGQSRPPDACAH